ncbi:hypothetical protein AeMF1_016643 [Aphanomyces euteiches]|nr:hypothetical protein AeMF1_016643 [Aphanomyces euteiches]
MLAFTTLLDQTNQSAANHASTIENVLQQYQNTKQNLLFMVSDNTNTMPLVAKLLQCPFIGCASHRLAVHIKKALAVPNEDNDDTPQNSINKVNRLMTKLKSANKAGALRYETHLKPVIRNVTRWSSTFAMIQRYNQLRDLIDRRDKELIPFLLTPNEDDEIELWEASLRRVNDITIALQSDKTTLFDARALLDGVVALNLPHADLTLHITRDAKIVKCVDFECGIVKVLGDREQDLTPAEKEQLETFRSSNFDEATPSSGNFALDILNSAKKQKVLSKYVNLEFIPATSVIAEREFSQSSLVFTEMRQSMTPLHLHCVAFLKHNKS